MVAHTLEALQQVGRLEATLVVLASDDTQFERHTPGFSGRGCWVARCGGATRAETVSNGLVELLARGARPDDWVLVHDAARCLIRPQWVDRLIDACWNDDIGGLLAFPVADTLKKAEGGRVVTTIDRSDKWVAQTPQMFRIGALAHALAHASPGVTDESSAMEQIGALPLIVSGELGNLKITWPGDFRLAEALLASKE